ncbi:MAG: hypothetical protein JO250_22665 [Armatimonadetes bacterium]|nr:hypothetical protein [Armatimonadota bacterium]
MTDIARLRFKSIKRPKEHGALVLSDDGTFRIEPSREFREEMARLEEEALERSQAWGTRLGLGLMALGGLALALGWYAGRTFGQLGNSLSAPRSIRDVEVTRDDNGNLHVRMPGAESHFQKIQMGWHADEYLAPEADKFLQTFEEMRG